MSVHGPLNVAFITNNGLVMKEGGSTKLAKGQFGIVDRGAPNTINGMKVTSTYPSAPKDRKFQLRLGSADVLSRSLSNKSYESRPFKLSEVEDIRVTYPSLTSTVDELIIGFDGVNDDTAITLENGQVLNVDINLQGDGVGLLDYPDAKAQVKISVVAPQKGAFTMQEIVEKAIKEVKGFKMNGQTSVAELIDITPVNSKQVAVTGTKYKTHTLKVKGTGYKSALANVQAQYPLYNIKQTGYSKGITEFTTVVPSATVLAGYKVLEADVTLDCGEYDSSTIKTLETIAWVAGPECDAIETTYTIQLADPICGDTREADLTAFYPGLTIVKGASKGCQTVYSTKTLSNIVCPECDPIFLDMFTSEGPQDFEGISWTEAPKVYDATALMGIRIKGKVTISAGDEAFRDTIPQIYDFIRIDASAYTTANPFENFGVEPRQYFNVKRLSRGTRPSALGMDFYEMEEYTRNYFTGERRFVDNHFGNIALGKESLLEPTSQYVMHSITIQPTRYAQSNSQTHTEHIQYNILSKVGYHKDVEVIVNALATAAGLPTVQSYDGN